MGATARCFITGSAAGATASGRAAARAAARAASTSAAAAASAGNAAAAPSTAGRSSGGSATHPLVVHAHGHVGEAQREGGRSAGGEGEAQARRPALAGGSRTLVLQPIALHAVAGGVHDAAAQLATAATARLQEITDGLAGETR